MSNWCWLSHGVTFSKVNQRKQSRNKCKRSGRNRMRSREDRRFGNQYTTHPATPKREKHWWGLPPTICNNNQAEQRQNSRKRSDRKPLTQEAKTGIRKIENPRKYVEKARNIVRDEASNELPRQCGRRQTRRRRIGNVTVGFLRISE